jgi:Ca2+-binding RTX toxin-like protein
MGESMKIEVLSVTTYALNFGFKSIGALAFREGLTPIFQYQDATKALVNFARGAVWFELRGEGISFTPETMSGTVNQVTVSDGIYDLLIRYSDLDMKLGDLDWGNPHVMLAGDDVILGSNLSDDIWGLDGDDRLVGRDGPDTLHGGDGDDKLVASGGRDQVFGEDGGDLLIGGAGNDLLFGGGGRDAFRFNDAVRFGDDRETVGDFGLGNDRIELDKDGFPGIGPKGRLDTDDFGVITKSGTITNPDAKILFDVENNQLLYDRDGAGGRDMKLIAIVFSIEGPVNLGADDIFVV